MTNFLAAIVLTLALPIIIPVPKAEGDTLVVPEEKRLMNVRQLTFGGKNAEAYFSFDGTRLIFQSTRDEFQCDQIFIMNTDGSEVRRVSTGKGQTTCAYFFPGDQEILYSSTHLRSPDCPPPPPRGKRYIWPLHPFDIFRAKVDGTNLRRLTFTGDYNAEATVSRDGRIVFTSLREGDLDIYIMNRDGSGVRRLTYERGYDGGAFFSADGRMIVYRAFHPRRDEDVRDYEEHLKKRQVVGGTLELFVMEADGSNRRQITHYGASSFCPFFHPSGKQIIFSSNLHQPEGRQFSLYLIRLDGTQLERITFHPGFEAFPIFSPDGRKLVFISNRNAKAAGEFNIFIADWVP